MDRHAKSIFFNFRPDNRIITFAPPSASISPFPVRFDQVNSTCLARNLIFYLKVALLVKPIYYRFVHTSSTHGPHIKSTSRAISQYIHCWEYFQWVKSYTYLKFHAMRVRHLWLSASYGTAPKNSINSKRNIQDTMNLGKDLFNAWEWTHNLKSPNAIYLLANSNQYNLSVNGEMTQVRA